MSIWSRTKRAVGTRPLVPMRIMLLSVDGFSLRPDDSDVHNVRVHWADVTRICTYKLDLFTTDCICLLFEQDGGEPAQVLEEWEGFVDLMGVLRDHFPHIPEDWYAAVMKPAFVRNETVLFERHRG